LGGAAQRYTATLAKPLASDTDVIAEGNIFQCKGTTCNLVSAPVDAGSVYTCRKLAREAERSRPMATEPTTSTQPKLAKCNSKVSG